MKRSTFLHASFATLVGFSLTNFASAQTTRGVGLLGRLRPADYERLNREVGEKIAALKPTTDPLTGEDQQLLNEIAKGGSMQLEASQLALTKAKSVDVKAIATGEAAEQTGLAAKLKELASAKRVATSEALDEKGQQILARLQKLEGDEFDKAYLKEIGVDGHELLKTTMERVAKRASDSMLRQIAAAALPLILVHLQVAKDEAADMG